MIANITKIKKIARSNIYSLNFSFLGHDAKLNYVKIFHPVGNLSMEHPGYSDHNFFNLAKCVKRVSIVPPL